MVDQFVFWEDPKNKILTKNLFSEIAENSAKKVIKAEKMSEKDRANANNPTQIRKFFDEIVSIEAKFKSSIKDGSDENRKLAFKQHLPYIYMLLPKAKYAEARKLISPEFTELLDIAINNVKEPDDIKVLVSFFEAFIGYFKYEKVKNDNLRKSNFSQGRSFSNANNVKREYDRRKF